MDGPFRKTAKGVQAIASRSRELPTRLRPLLILIDGQRRLADLQAMAGQFGDVPQMLAQLVQEGYAEPLGPPAAAAPGAAPAVSAASRPPPTLAQARLAASRLLLELMGPTSEALCLRLETARSRADLVEAARRAHALLRELRGPEAAARFADAVEANLPAE